MAAGAFTFYNQFAELVADGTIDLDNDTFKLALLTSSYTPNAASDTTFSVIDANEHAAENGYSAGGEALTSVTWGQSSGVGTFDAADVEWTASGGSITARYAVLHDSTVGGAGDLIGYFLLDSTPADVTATDGNTLTVQWHGDGIFTLDVTGS